MKKILIIAAAVLMTGTANAHPDNTASGVQNASTEQAQVKPRAKVAVVLSGGGAKGISVC